MSEEEKNGPSIIPAYKRLRQVLGNRKSSPGEIGQTLMMLKHVSGLPKDLQEQMNRLEVPIFEITSALHRYASDNPEEAKSILLPVLQVEEKTRNGI